MDQAVLVNFDIENGKEVIDALDREGKAPNVALWAKLPDYENWRLVIASDRLRSTRPVIFPFRIFGNQFCNEEFGDIRASPTVNLLATHE